MYKEVFSTNIHKYWKSKKEKKIFHVNITHNKAEVALLMFEKVDLKKKKEIVPDINKPLS